MIKNYQDAIFFVFSWFISFEEREKQSLNTIIYRMY